MARLGLLSLILICGTAQSSFGWQPVPRLGNQTVAEMIADALRKAGLQGADITIEFRGGEATLEGRVPDLAQKLKAGEVTSGIPGVTQTIDLLKVGQEAPEPDAEPVPPLGKSTNQQMAEKIAAALRNAHLKGSDITIEFQGGVAKLAGLVPHAAQKQTVSDIVSRIPGVKETVNSLKVGDAESESVSEDAPSHPEQGDDLHAGLTNQQVAEKIADALRDCGFSGYDIQISFEGGVATLETD